jgi:EmrB/QacA subfamily drug resistance transporter
MRIWLQKRRQGLTILGVALSIFMGALESTVVGTAMPTVIASLGGIEIYGWVFAAYILAATIMTPVWGKMADLIGRRPAMFGGLALFILGSALSGAAQSMPQLIAFRVLQGLGNAALFPVGMTIVADLLSLEKRAKLIGIFSGMWGVASLVGPLVGGYLTTYVSWRWCFYLILPAGMVSGLLIWATYEERFARRREIVLDYWGTATITGGLVLLLLLVERGAGLPIWQVVVGSGICLGLFASFVLLERRHADPLIPLDLFQNRLVVMAVVHGLVSMMALIGTMSFLPLFVQAVIGTTAAEAGKILIPYIIPWVVSSIIGGRLILRFGYRPVALWGMVSMLIGAIGLAQVSVGTTRLVLSVDIGFLGMGGGLTVATMMLAAQHAVGRLQTGVTTSTVQFARSIGSAVGTSAMGAIMTWRLRTLLGAAPPELIALGGHGEVGLIVRPETRAALSGESALFLQQALAGSLRWSFYFVLATVLIASIIALFIPRGNALELAHVEHRDTSTSIPSPGVEGTESIPSEKEGAPVARSLTKSR